MDIGAKIGVADTEAIGAAQLASLPQLAQETELQKMLADEKMRSEQHRTNYQVVKAEYQK